MNRIAVVVLAVAVVSGLVAGVLTFVYLREPDADDHVPTGNSPASQNSTPQRRQLTQVPLDPAGHLRHRRMLASDTVRVTAAKGARLALDSGLVVDLPPGSLRADSAVQIEHVLADAKSNGLLADLEYLRIRAPDNGSPLAAPVRVTLPLREKPDQLDVDQIAVYHMSEQGQVERLPSQVDLAAGTLSFETKSFSWFWVLLAGSSALAGGDVALSGDLRAAADEVILGNERKVIRSSYYTQADYEWCWAATTSMVFSSHGYMVQPQAVAELFKAGTSTGGSFWPWWLGADQISFAKVAQKLGVPADESAYKEYALGGLTEKNLRGWLIVQLRRDRPVWVGLRKYSPKGSDHAILVTGYDNVGFYIHDPSGALIDEIYRRRAKRPGPAGRATGATDVGKLALFRIRYGEWQNIMAPGVFDYRPWLTNLAIFDVAPETPPADLIQSQPDGTWRAWPVVRVSKLPRTATLQILPAGSERDFEFHRDGYSFAGWASILFYWNGLLPAGCGFARSEALPIDDRTPRQDALSPPPGRLSNSDGVTLLRPVVHNTSDRPFRGAIRLLLDGQKIGPDTPLVSVAAETTNHHVDVVAPRGLETRTDDPARPAPYMGIGGRSKLTPAEALDFVRHPLPPGNHQIDLLLLDVVGQELDRVTVPLQVAPAVVYGASARKISLPGTGQIVHQVSWRGSPEAGRSAAPHVYKVYRMPAKDRAGASARLVATLSDPKEPTVSVPAPEDVSVQTAFRYAVTYVDAASGLESPLSQPTAKLDGGPTRSRSLAKNPAEILDRVVRPADLAYRGKAPRPLTLKNTYVGTFAGRTTAWRNYEISGRALASMRVQLTYLPSAKEARQQVEGRIAAWQEEEAEYKAAVQRASRPETDRDRLFRRPTGPPKELRAEVISLGDLAVKQTQWVGGTPPSASGSKNSRLVKQIALSVGNYLFHIKFDVSDRSAEGVDRQYAETLPEQVAARIVAECQ